MNKKIIVLLLFLTFFVVGCEEKVCDKNVDGVISTENKLGYVFFSTPGYVYKNDVLISQSNEIYYKIFEYGDIIHICGNIDRISGNCFNYTCKNIIAPGDNILINKNCTVQKINPHNICNSDYAMIKYVDEINCNIKIKMEGYEVYMFEKSITLNITNKESYFKYNTNLYCINEINMDEDTIYCTKNQTCIKYKEGICYVP